MRLMSGTCVVVASMTVKKTPDATAVLAKSIESGASKRLRERRTTARARESVRAVSIRSRTRPMREAATTGRLSIIRSAARGPDSMITREATGSHTTQHLNTGMLGVHVAHVESTHTRVVVTRDSDGRRTLTRTYGIARRLSEHVYVVTTSRRIPQIGCGVAVVGVLELKATALVCL